jgi:hypothetical protein
MKKAKLFLTAAGIVAAVGGVLALKANMRGGELLCSTTKSTDGSSCTITATKNPTVTEYLYCTTQTSDPDKCTAYTRIKREA